LQELRRHPSRQETTRRLGEALTYFIRTETELDRAIASLIKIDQRFAPAFDLAGRPPLRKRGDGYAGLASIVVSQQLSTASARAIWGRLEAKLDPLDHIAVLKARAPTLARVGLSAPKIRALKEIAKAIARGDLDLPALADMPADDAHRILTAVHGIGPWTADIYLLFCLGHADAWPAGDLALQEAARLLFKLKSRPTTKEMQPLAEAWHPWRGAAAYLLWTYYRVAKRREGAPIPAVAQQASGKPTKAKQDGTKQVSAKLASAKRVDPRNRPA
jgi:DNA-3-methyladenine glycosylase II